MAYDTVQRFKSAPVYYRIFDPGAYQNINPPLLKLNRAPFLSKTPRHIKNAAKLWTHEIYNIDLPKKIPNCTSIQSKLPRFSYETLSEEDIKELLCRCGLNDPCECDVDEKDYDQSKEPICQGKVPRWLFKGPTLKSQSKQKEAAETETESPRFYDTRVNESTAFYQGWKWSKWTSTRSQNKAKDTPGPADYILERKPDPNVTCAEKLRELRRKNCMQLRYLDREQRRNIREKFPGPASYSPMLPKGTVLQCLGSKADRFLTSKYNICPGPADYWVKRDFDGIRISKKSSHAKLRSRAPFGVSAMRFKPRLEEGPGPASYNAVYKPCLFPHCPTAPFGSSSDRFKDVREDNDDDESDVETECDDFKPHDCGPSPTWQFKSHTMRMIPLRKKLNEPSPADQPQGQFKATRSIRLQYSCPFHSSEGRFMPWHNYIPVHGKEKTPGPGYYCLETYKCQPAVHGPLYQSRRFPSYHSVCPAPNVYRIDRGIESILSTHNQKLKNNIKNQHKFHWKQPVKQLKLSLQELERKLLDRSIALLDSPDVENNTPAPENVKSITDQEQRGEKLLRCFLYSKQIEKGF